MFFFSENDDVIERKPSNEGINSIGLKRAKRKQKTHNGGDYCDLVFGRDPNNRGSLESSLRTIIWAWASLVASKAAKAASASAMVVLVASLAFGGHKSLQ